MFIWTETPLTEIWNQLRYFESSANVKNLLNKSTDSSRSPFVTHVSEIDARSKGIAACIRQAHEYFLASETVSLATKPLLLYYQFLSLAKVLLLANDDIDNILDLPMLHHGLKKDWTNTVPNPSLGDLSFQTGGGVFKLLYETVSKSTIPDGTTLVFKDLIRVIPDMSDLFFRYYGQPSFTYRFETFKTDVDHLSVSFSNGQNINTVLSDFPLLNTHVYNLQPEYVQFVAPDDVFLYDKQIATKAEGTIFGSYLIKPISGGLHDTTSAIYAAAYFLSDLVRYKPNILLDILEGHKDGSVAFINAFCHIAQRRFPNDILQHLWCEKFTFGNLGRLG